MTQISDEEQRVWKYLLSNKLAEAADVVMNCDVSLELAQSCIDRIGTPRRVFVMEAKGAQQEWDDETIALRAGLKEDEMNQRRYEGRKDDQNKAPYHLLAPELLEGIAQVLAFGAAKYAPRNWEMGMDWSRPFSALMRHMWAWWRGEAKDPETGMSHLWHAACCIMFLVAYEERKTGNDDRPNKV